MATRSRKTSPHVRQASSVSLAVSLTIHTIVFIALALAWRSGSSGPALVVSARFATTDSTSASSSDSNVPSAHIVTSMSEVTGELVERQIQNLISEHERMPADQQLDRLKKASRRLNRLSSAESIDEMAGQFHSWLALSPRAVEPVPSANDGEFDLNSAQVHDVTRHVDDKGEVTFVLVLLDARGRTHEMELDEEHGKTVYQLMERVKANPLLEKLYRQIVMPLLDQLVHGEED